MWQPTKCIVTECTMILFQIIIEIWNAIIDLKILAIGSLYEIHINWSKIFEACVKLKPRKI